MKKSLINTSIIGTFIFSIMFAFCLKVDAAYTRSVEKSHKYDYNTLLGTKGSSFDFKYIYVANDARLSSQEEKAVGSGWNYVRMQVIKYYKNADMNW